MLRAPIRSGSAEYRMNAVWIAVGVTLVLGGLVVAWLNLRRRGRPRLSDEEIQREVVEHLRRTLPSVTIATEKPREIKLAGPNDQEATMFLDNLIAAVNASRGRMEDRERIYGEFSRPLRVFAGVDTRPSLNDQIDKILPRLVHREYLENMGGAEVLNRRLGETPLHVAYVVDEEASVRFVTVKDLEELGMSAEQLDELAMKNFRPKLPEGAYRDIMERAGKATILSEGDSFDASRLLLVMERLGPGEVIAAAVPDRDTLVIVPRPDEATWAKLETVAATPRSSRVILGRPLRVTSLGIEVR
jgi:uncharacterized protein YtpQ (UPF0354 family)